MWSPLRPDFQPCLRILPITLAGCFVQLSFHYFWQFDHRHQVRFMLETQAYQNLPRPGSLFLPSRSEWRWPSKGIGPQSHPCTGVAAHSTATTHLEILGLSSITFEPLHYLTLDLLSCACCYFLNTSSILEFVFLGDSGDLVDYLPFRPSSCRRCPLRPSPSERAT